MKNNKFTYKNNIGLKQLITFLRNSTIFFVGAILSKILSFLLLPLYSSVIPPQDMGIYDISLTVMTMVASLCFFEIWSGVLRKCYDKYDYDSKIKSVISGLQIFLISSIVFIILSLCLSYLLNYKHKVLIIITMISQMFSNYCSFSARGLRKNKSFALSGLLASALCLSSNLLLLLGFKMDYSALYISAIIGHIGQSIYLIISMKLYKHFGLLFTWDKDNIKLIKFCLPLCINAVSYWFLNSLNRVVFNNIYGNAMSGVFAIGSRFSTMVTLVTTCFNYAWQDLSYNAGSKSNLNTASKLYTKGVNLYLYFLLCGFIVLIPILYFMAPIFVKGEYVDSIKLIPFFIFSAMVSGYSTFLGSTFYALKDTKNSFFTTFVGTITNIALCYPLIKTFGPYGVIASTTISFFVIIILRFYILHKKIKLVIRLHSILLFLLLVIMSTTIFAFFDWRANFSLLICSFFVLLFSTIKFVKKNKHT